MTQFLRPDSTVTAASFTGGFADIDESIASDADFAWSADSAAATLEVGLSNPTGTPGSGATTVRYRLAQTKTGVIDGTGSASTVTVYVMQGATIIATDAARTATGAWTTYTWSPGLSSVTDWTDLRLRFAVVGGGGSPANRRGAAISWAEVEAPTGLTTITGSMAATEAGADAFAASGSVSWPAITVSIAAVETDADVAAIDAASLVEASLAAVEADADQAAVAGSVAITASLAAQEAGVDQASISATVQSDTITGTVAVIEVGQDIAAASGEVVIAAAGAAQESGADTASAAGEVIIDGAMSAAETGADVATVSAGALIALNFEAVEDNADVAAIAAAIMAAVPREPVRLAADVRSVISFAAHAVTPHRADANHAVGPIRLGIIYFSPLTIAGESDTLFSSTRELRK